MTRFGNANLPSRCRGAVAIALLWILSAMTGPMALAHDPGLSYSLWVQEGDALSVELVLARRDVEPLLSREEPFGARAMTRIPGSGPLEGVAARAIEVTHGTRRVAPGRVRVEEDAGDGVRFRLEYRVSPGSPVRAELALLRELGRGHRHFVTWLNAGDGKRETWLLSAGHAQFDLSLREGTPVSQAFAGYLLDGIRHIWVGYDHLLFLLTLLLPAVLVRQSDGWRPVGQLRPALMEVMKTVTAFTAAHSITLSLAVLGIVAFPGRWIEAAIAASVIVAALNNLYPLVSASRWPLAFAFGLLHGLGFANVLIDAGLPSHTLTLALIGFNLGVELGQAAVVVMVVPLIYGLRRLALYDTLVLRGGSAIAAGIAGVWLLQRLLDPPVWGA